MDNQILIDYLLIAQTEDLYALAFEYACDNQWELLSLVTIELSKRWIDPIEFNVVQKINDIFKLAVDKVEQV